MPMLSLFTMGPCIPCPQSEAVESISNIVATVIDLQRTALSSSILYTISSRPVSLPAPFRSLLEPRSHNPAGIPASLAWLSIPSPHQSGFVPHLSSRPPNRSCEAAFPDPAQTCLAGRVRLLPATERRCP